MVKPNQKKQGSDGLKRGKGKTKKVLVDRDMQHKMGERGKQKTLIENTGGVEYRGVGRVGGKGN